MAIAVCGRMETSSSARALRPIRNRGCNGIRQRLDRYQSVICHLSFLIALSALESPPRPSSIPNECLGLRRTPAAGRIESKRALFLAPVPFFLDFIDESPCFFDLISSGKKGRIPSHRIQQQTFICFRTRCPERRAVMKVHLYRLNPNTGSRDFRLHAQRDSFIRLNPNDEHVLRAVTYPQLIPIE